MTLEVRVARPNSKRILAGEICSSTGPVASSSRRRASCTVLRGTITPGSPAAPSGAAISARARRWPSVATARRRGPPPSLTVWR